MVGIKDFELSESCKDCKLTYKDSIGKSRCIFSKKKIEEIEYERELHCKLFSINEE